MAEKEVDSAEARAKTIMATAEREAEASKREALVEAKDGGSAASARRPRPT